MLDDAGEKRHTKHVDPGSGERICVREYAAGFQRLTQGGEATDKFRPGIALLLEPIGIDQFANHIRWISDDGSVARAQHFLAGLRISDGSKVHDKLLNLEGAVYTPPGGLPVQKFVSIQRKQRSALTLTQNHVLIPFGTSERPDSVVLRPIDSVDGMTASVVRMPANLLRDLTTRLRDVEGIGGVFYDLTNKPPGTIEWE